MSTRRSKDGLWEIVSLPAINDAGESLWPSRWPVEALRAKRSLVGEYEWAALFQQAPVPKGGKVFRAPSYYDPMPAAYGAPARRISLACDPAGSDSTRADHTAAVALEFLPLPRATREVPYPLPVAWVVEVLRGQWDTARAVKELRAFQLRHGNASLVIESTRDGKDIARALRQIDPTLQLASVTPRGDKFVRAQPAAAAWNEGRLLVPRSAPWLADFLLEVSRFTGVGDKADDQVDALSYAWSLGMGGGTAGGQVDL